MTAKKDSTMAQLVSRTYRRQLAIAWRLSTIEATLRLNHDTDHLTKKTQADTIARLLRQHDTLKRMPSWPQMERELIAANAYIAEPLKPGALRNWSA
jgi:hypothetical protein